MIFEHTTRYRLLGMIACISLLSIASYGQNEKIDSLRIVVNEQGDVEQKVDDLILLASEFAFLSEYDSVELYAQSALDLAEKLGYEKGIADSHYKLNVGAQRTSRFSEAADHLAVYNAYYSKVGDVKNVAKGWYNLAYIFYYTGRIDSSLVYNKKCLDFYFDLQDTMMLLAINNQTGNCFIDLTNLDSAVYYFLEAANLAEASGRMNYLSVMYTNLGKVFYRLDQFEKSKKYYLMALEISRKNNDRHLLVQSLSGLGTLYKQMHELDTSLAYYNQAYQLVDTNIKNLQLGDIYANTGAIYHDKGNLDKALPYYQAAFKIYQDVDYPEGILALLNNIGQAYSSLNKYKEASIYLDSGLRLAIYYKFDTKRNKLLNSISENYYNWGDYKKAYEFLVRHKLLSDSIFNLDNSKMIHELETKYQKQQDQALILTLEKENLLKTIQKNAILYSAIALIMLALFLVLYLRQRMTKNKIIAEQKIRQLEEEKKFLSAKLLVEGQEEERKRIARELHDGLGVLLSATKMQFTSLKLSLPENKELFDRAVKLLEQASGDVRKISHNMMPGLLTKLGFYEAVEDLIDNVKDTPGLHAECIIEGDQSRLPENEEIMLYRVVQEMVNNTIKHARAKNITLQVTRAGKELQLIYKDDGVGFDAEKVLASPTASLGLKSIQSRIGFLNGDLRIDSAPGQGVRYTVTVPV